MALFLQEYHTQYSRFPANLASNVVYAKRIIDLELVQEQKQKEVAGEISHSVNSSLYMFEDLFEFLEHM